MTLVSLEDARDIEAARHGDGDAYARLVRRYQDEIARYLWRFSRQRAVCEELLQDVFVEAYLSLRSFKGRSPLLHWLRRIATRVGYRYWKSRGSPASRVEFSAALSVAASEAPAADAAEALHAVLAQLPPRDRLVLTLMYLEELPIADIAELTGWTKAMVKVQVHRARGKLRTLLKKQERGQ